MIQFGRVKKFDAGRVTVALTGLDSDATIEALWLQPGSLKGPSVWLPPAVDDLVVVAYDDERPENSVVLGVVYPDGKNPPKTGADEIAIQAGKVYIGDDVSKTKACPRDDRVQDQLKAIKSELDSFVSAYNAHVHTVPVLTVHLETLPNPTAGPGTTAATTSRTQTYSVGSTASDSVEVK